MEYMLINDLLLGIPIMVLFIVVVIVFFITDKRLTRLEKRVGIDNAENKDHDTK